ncbi:MAG: (Fe-S)-binding protein [Syntrophobacterales bacterium]|nr:MAG: (Fe-S)-binding protein [Syntrophobacterales bacterium]
MMKGKSLNDYTEDIYTCNRTRCGFCREQCPVYHVKVYETYSCRGKMLVGRGLIEKTLSPSVEITQILDRCLLCGLCEARCALNNLDIITSMRREMVHRGCPTPVHKGNVERILEEGRLLDARAAPERDGQFTLYVGCVYRSKPRELATALSVLERLDIHPLIADETCCGYIVEATGFDKEFEMIQGQFKKTYQQMGAPEILTLCPTCTATLKEKYGLPVKHAIVAVAEQLRKKQQAVKPLGFRATYHDPCHLGRMLGVFDEPREILRHLGIQLVEMENYRYFSTCCGGGGGVNAVDPDLSIEIAKNRARDAIGVGVEIITTVCPTCEPTLLRAAGRLAGEVGTFVDVQGLWDLLDKALD